MPVSGRKPKGYGGKRNRVKPVHDWIEVTDEPFAGSVPVKLPAKRVLSSPEGPYEVAVHPMTRQWWRTVSSMPHAVLWTASDWQFVLATALVADDFHHDHGGRGAASAGEDPRRDWRCSPGSAYPLRSAGR
jgi:hypothetical protein